MGSSVSTSQRDELQPHEAMLRQHEHNASIPPKRYAGSQAVNTVLDRVAAAELELARAVGAANDALSREPLDPEGGFQFLDEHPPLLDALL